MYEPLGMFLIVPFDSTSTRRLPMNVFVMIAHRQEIGCLSYEVIAVYQDREIAQKEAERLNNEQQPRNCTEDQTRYDVHEVKG